MLTKNGYSSKENQYYTTNPKEIV
jgi:hypothetical protein